MIRSAKNMGLIVISLVWTAHGQAIEHDGPMRASATMGERLFLETRFAQFFFARSHGDANFKLTAGDPVLNSTQSANGRQPGHFAGQSMNCRACHLVDEFNDSWGNRTYCDFTARSPVPDIGDGVFTTPRNAATLVNLLYPHPGPSFFHADGQFATVEDLVISTLTGRDFGWSPSQSAVAVAHIAHIIRDDDGTGELAKGRFGGGYSYADILGPTPNKPPVSPLYRLNLPFLLGDLRIKDPKDPGFVTDQRIMKDVAALIAAYLQTLTFSHDEAGDFNGSPYDAFVKKNHLPAHPGAGQTAQQYGDALLAAVSNLSNPQYVTDGADGHFITHAQSFQFGAQELEGLKIFLTRNAKEYPGRAGNCAACHAPPVFTDFVFHNTGATQEEYDALHGAGAFQKLAVPGLSQRESNPNDFLPGTAQHPRATGRFASPPAVDNPGLADLGLWNVFANPDFPAPQAGLQKVLPALVGKLMTAGETLPLTIGLFKTPSLRDLGQCEPYLHTGRKKTIEEVVVFYREFSEKARQGNVRNADPNLGRISLDDTAVAPLSAFLRSLNEDYRD